MLRPPSPIGKDSTARPRTTPLGAVLALAWLASVGTAVAWAGIYFITERDLGYTRMQNLTLAAALGFAYALAALFATPITGIVARRGPLLRSPPPGPRASARAVLGLVLVIGAGLALIPVLWTTEWSIWVFGLTYAPLTGLLWPAIEQYVSSGRRGHDLNRATGAFNLAWASAILIAMWCMVPLIEHHPRWIIGALTPLHLLALLPLARFNPEPHAHGDPASDHDPAQESRYRTLLHLARGMLFLSYVLHASLMPIIPQLMGQLGIAAAAKPALASVWMTTRLCAFATMQRTRAWHGKRATIALGCVLMLIAYAGCIGATSATMLAIALALFGVGVGMIYSAAIYYALEVGSSDIEAGAKHEAMIGLGYGVGPVIAIVARSILPGG